MFGLPPAHELGNILGECDRVGERGILGCELREPLLLLGRTSLRPSQDEPGRPARGQGAVRRRSYERQGVASSPRPRCLPLRLAQTLGVAGDRGITAGVAQWLDLPEEPQRVTTTRVPALEEIGYVGREETAAAVCTALTRGQGLRSEVTKHGILANPQLLGNGPAGPPLLMEGPDLLMKRQPPRLPLVSQLLGLPWR